VIIVDQDCVVDVAHLPTSAPPTRLLSGLKREDVFHHAQASIT
jgi:hypothetical protein